MRLALVDNITGNAAVDPRISLFVITIKLLTVHVSSERVTARNVSIWIECFGLFGLLLVSYSDSSYTASF